MSPMLQYFLTNSIRFHFPKENDAFKKSGGSVRMLNTIRDSTHILNTPELVYKIQSAHHQYQVQSQMKAAEQQ